LQALPEFASPSSYWLGIVWGVINNLFLNIEIMKNLSLLNINKDQLKKKELHKIRGGDVNCSCTGTIYVSSEVKDNGGLPKVCLCDDSDGDSAYCKSL